jgi:hypothetical protein
MIDDPKTSATNLRVQAQGLRLRGDEAGASILEQQARQVDEREELAQLGTTPEAVRTRMRVAEAERNKATTAAIMQGKEVDLSPDEYYPLGGATSSAATALRVATSGSNGARVRRDPLARFREALISADDLDRLPDVEPLVQGVLEKGTLAVLYGPAGSGKSFVADDLGLSIAAGVDWFDRPLDAGPVLYIAAEGRAGIRIRVEAWKHAHDVDQVPGFHVLPVAVNLLNDIETAAVAEIAAELGVVLVIVDTLNRTMPGGDENSPKDMGNYVAACDTIRETSGACVLIVHHTGKDRAAGARGHTALKGAVDTELELRDPMLLVATKQKNMEDGDVLERFQLAPIGESCVVERADARAASPRSALVELCVLIDDCDMGTGVPSGTLRNAPTTAVGASTFYRRLKEAREEGLIVNRGSETRPRWALSLQGREEIHSHAPS